MKILQYFRTPNRFLLLLAGLSVISLTPLLTGITAGLVFVFGKFGILLALGVYFLFLPIPALFTIGFIAWLVYRVFVLFFKPIHWFYCILIALVLLAIPANLINLKFDAEIKKLIANDTDLVAKISTVSTIALVTNDKNIENRCGQVCFRLLWNKQVVKVILSEATSPIGKLDTSLMGQAYWLEKRQQCPKVNNSAGSDNFNMNFSDWNAFNLQYQSMRTDGYCLIKAPQLIANSDAIILIGNVTENKRILDAGIDPLDPFINAQRFALYAHHAGAFSLKFQTTNITVYKHFPILFLLPIASMDAPLHSSYIRYKQRLINGQRSNPLRSTLNKGLGLKLVIKDLFP